jgi:hypothetical protein
MTATRVYKMAPKQVTEETIGAARPQPRLIEAASQAQAYSHVARSTWTASVATQTDLIDLVGTMRIVVEKASQE